MDTKEDRDNYGPCSKRRRRTSVDGNDRDPDDSNQVPVPRSSTCSKEDPQKPTRARQTDNVHCSSHHEDYTTETSHGLKEDQAATSGTIRCKSVVDCHLPETERSQSSGVKIVQKTFQEVSSIPASTPENLLPVRISGTILSSRSNFASDSHSEQSTTKALLKCIKCQCMFPNPKPQQVHTKEFENNFAFGQFCCHGCFNKSGRLTSLVERVQQRTSTERDPTRYKADMEAPASMNFPEPLTEMNNLSSPTSHRPPIQAVDTPMVLEEPDTSSEESSGDELTEGSLESTSSDELSDDKDSCLPIIVSVRSLAAGVTEEVTGEGQIISSPNRTSAPETPAQRLPGLTVEEGGLPSEIATKETSCKSEEADKLPESLPVVPKHQALAVKADACNARDSVPVSLTNVDLNSTVSLMDTSDSSLVQSAVTERKSTQNIGVVEDTICPTASTSTTKECLGTDSVAIERIQATESEDKYTDDNYHVNNAGDLSPEAKDDSNMEDGEIASVLQGWSFPKWQYIKQDRRLAKLGMLHPMHPSRDVPMGKILLSSGELPVFLNRFTKEREFWQAVREHPIENKWQCPFCPSYVGECTKWPGFPLHAKGYCDKMTVINHVLIYHYPFVDIMECPSCPFKSVHWNVFSNHMMSCESQKLSCPPSTVVPEFVPLTGPSFNEHYIPPYVPTWLRVNQCKNEEVYQVGPFCFNKQVLLDQEETFTEMDGGCKIFSSTEKSMSNDELLAKLLVRGTGIKLEDGLSGDAQTETSKTFTSALHHKGESSLVPGSAQRLKDGKCSQNTARPENHTGFNIMEEDYASLRSKSHPVDNSEPNFGEPKGGKISAQACSGTAKRRVNGDFAWKTPCSVQLGTLHPAHPTLKRISSGQLSRVSDLLENAKNEFFWRKVKKHCKLEGKLLCPFCPGSTEGLAGQPGYPLRTKGYSILALVHHVLMYHYPSIDHMKCKNCEFSTSCWSGFVGHLKTEHAFSTKSKQPDAYRGDVPILNVYYIPPTVPVWLSTFPVGEGAVLVGPFCFSHPILPQKTDNMVKLEQKLLSPGASSHVAVRDVHTEAVAQTPASISRSIPDDILKGPTDNANLEEHLETVRKPSTKTDISRTDDRSTNLMAALSNVKPPERVNIVTDNNEQIMTGKDSFPKLVKNVSDASNACGKKLLDKSSGYQLENNDDERRKCKSKSAKIVSGDDGKGQQIKETESASIMHRMNLLGHSHQNTQEHIQTEKRGMKRKTIDVSEHDKRTKLDDYTSLCPGTSLAEKRELLCKSETIKVPYDQSAKKVQSRRPSVPIGKIDEPAKEFSKEVKHTEQGRTCTSNLNDRTFSSPGRTQFTAEMGFLHPMHPSNVQLSSKETSMEITEFTENKAYGQFWNSITTRSPQLLYKCPFCRLLTPQHVAWKGLPLLQDGYSQKTILVNHVMLYHYPRVDHLKCTKCYFRTQSWGILCAHFHSHHEDEASSLKTHGISHYRSQVSSYNKNYIPPLMSPDTVIRQYNRRVFEVGPFRFNKQVLLDHTRAPKDLAEAYTKSGQTRRAKDSKNSIFELESRYQILVTSRTPKTDKPTNSQAASVDSGMDKVTSASKRELTNDPARFVEPLEKSGESHVAPLPWGHQDLKLFYQKDLYNMYESIQEQGESKFLLPTTHIDRPMLVPKSLTIESSLSSLAEKRQDQANINPLTLAERLHTPALSGRSHAREMMAMMREMFEGYEEMVEHALSMTSKYACRDGTDSGARLVENAQSEETKSLQEELQNLRAQLSYQQSSEQLESSFVDTPSPVSPFHSSLKATLEVFLQDRSIPRADRRQLYMRVISRVMQNDLDIPVWFKQPE